VTYIDIMTRSHFEIPSKASIIAGVVVSVIAFLLISNYYPEPSQTALQPSNDNSFATFIRMPLILVLSLLAGIIGCEQFEKISS
jgi:hypothetical protein